MDYIEIKNLEVFARHGAIPEENVLGQKFLISVKLYCNTRMAGLTDDLNQSVNYAEVSNLIKQITESNTFQLIERLAEYLAEQILLKFAVVKLAEVEIQKPWAPVMLPLDTVAVHICRGWHQVYLSIGSNIGDKKAHLDQAIEELRQDVQTEVVRVSEYAVTDPVGGVKQDDFLNAALEIRTLRSPEEMLDLIGEIESQQKRERLVHWGPRTIDLDILLYDDIIMQTERLTIPHIEMNHRDFVLEPMKEIAPYKVHPVNGKTMQELYISLLQ